MRYESKDEAIKAHVDNYRSDGVVKGKGTRYSSDFHRVDFVVQKTPKGSRVLDIGCNGGTIAIRLMAERGCYVKGLDVVVELVEKAKKRGVFAEVGEAEDLSRFKDESFGVVICCEVLEHLYDPLVAIKEAYRVLSPGGTYIVTIPHPASEMCKKVGDYHQMNYSIEIVNTLFHSVFKKGDVQFWNLPYIEEYCATNNLNPNAAQWLALVAVKRKD